MPRYQADARGRASRRDPRASAHHVAALFVCAPRMTPPTAAIEQHDRGDLEREQMVGEEQPADPARRSERRVHVMRVLESCRRP